jgi:hypothetical protein
LSTYFENILQRFFQKLCNDFQQLRMRGLCCSTRIIPSILLPHSAERLQAIGAILPDETTLMWMTSNCKLMELTRRAVRHTITAAYCTIEQWPHGPGD